MFWMPTGSWATMAFVVSDITAPANISPLVESYAIVEEAPVIPVIVDTT